MSQSAYTQELNENLLLCSLKHQDREIKWVEKAFEVEPVHRSVVSTAVCILIKQDPDEENDIVTSHFSQPMY